MIVKADSLYIPLKDESVHCVVTSPPYWGLRVYQIPDSIWDGDPECEHQWDDATYQRRSNDGGESNRKQTTNAGAIERDIPVKNAFCSLCSAWKGQLGLEPRMGMYINHIVQIFREIKRVLQKDGTVWLVIGDSCASGKGSCYNPGGGERSLGKHLKIVGVHNLKRSNISDLKEMNLKPKDLCMIPARVAIALQEDGWWVRSEIIWAKKAPMCESVEDRPTRTHESIFLLAKSKEYFYDHEAIKEAQEGYEKVRRLKEKQKGLGTIYKLKADGKTGLNPHSQTGCVHSVAARGEHALKGTRNCRDVWLLNPQPSKIPHYATFPDEIPLRCIKAGTSEKGCCPKCGAPWKRIIEKGLTGHDGETMSRYPKGSTANRLALLRQAARERGEEYSNQAKTIGWAPGCSCGQPDTVPCVVLDPFAGSGTTLRVAESLGRLAVGLDLGYHELARIKTSNNQIVLSMET